MRTPALLTLLGVLCLPIAAAGPSAEAALLEESARCGGASESYSDGSYDNGSWWSYGYGSSWSECSDRYEYARAAAERDGRTLAEAEVAREQGNATREDRSWWAASDPYGYSYSGHERESRRDSAARTVEVRTIEGDVVVRDGCSSSSAETSYDSYSSRPSGNDSYSSWSSYDQAGGSSSECGQSVAATHAGEDVRAGYGTTCRDASASRRSYSYSEGASWGDESAQGDRACEDGLRVGALGERATAGREASCAHRGSAYWYPSGDGGSSYASSSSSDCADGQVVRVGEDLEIWIGTATHESQSCSDGQPCQGSSTSHRSVVLASRHVGAVAHPLP